MMQPLVLDVYHGDDVRDWNAVYDFGIRGVIHKSTQGTTVVDRAYAKRRERAVAAKLLWGAYHFASDCPVAEQVRHFLNIAAPDDDMLLALDYEPNGNHTMNITQAREFLQRVADRTGRLPVLYSGNLIKETLHQPDPFFNKHRLWLAQYGPRAVLPAGWNSYWLHQYTGDGLGPQPHECPGVETRGIDLNVFNGTEEDLRAQWSGADPSDKETATDPAPRPAEVGTGEGQMPPPPVGGATPREPPHPISTILRSQSIWQKVGGIAMAGWAWFNLDAQHQVFGLVLLGIIAILLVTALRHGRDKIELEKLRSLISW